MDKLTISEHNKKMLEKMEKARFVGIPLETVACYFCPESNKNILNKKFAKSKFPCCNDCRSKLNLSVRKNGLFV